MKTSSKCIDRKKITNNREEAGSPAGAPAPSPQAHKAGQSCGDTDRRKTELPIQFYLNRWQSDGFARTLNCYVLFFPTREK